MTLSEILAALGLTEPLEPERLRAVWRIVQEGPIREESDSFVVVFGVVRHATAPGAYVGSVSDVTVSWSRSLNIDPSRAAVGVAEAVESRGRLAVARYEAAAVFPSHIEITQGGFRTDPPWIVLSPPRETRAADVVTWSWSVVGATGATWVDVLVGRSEAEADEPPAHLVEAVRSQGLSEVQQVAGATHAPPSTIDLRD